MKLDTFIKDTLLQIISGVSEAQKEAKDLINPVVSGLGAKDKCLHTGLFTIHNVIFDVAVSVEDSTGANAGAKISVLGASLGGKLDESSLSKTVTRIKFEIPIQYPNEKQQG